MFPSANSFKYLFYKQGMISPISFRNCTVKILILININTTVLYFELVDLLLNPLSSLMLLFGILLSPSRFALLHYFFDSKTLLFVLLCFFYNTNHSVHASQFLIF